MHLLRLKSWSWCWVPGGARVEVADLSPSPWVGCPQRFLFNNGQGDARGDAAGKPQAAHPLVSKSEGEHGER